MRLRRTGADAVLFSKSKHQGPNSTGGTKKGGLSKRKGKCFKCKKLGHWARDCPENKNEELAAILIADRQGSTSSVSKKTDDGKAPIVREMNDIAQEKIFDAMEICSGKIGKQYRERILSKPEK